MLLRQSTQGVYYRNAIFFLLFQHISAFADKKNQLIFALPIKNYSKLGFADKASPRWFLSKKSAEIRKNLS